MNGCIGEFATLQAGFYLFNFKKKYNGTGKKRG